MARDQECIVALGGNLSRNGRNPDATLRLAIGDLRDAGVQITAVSRFYETPCFPAGAGPDYVNAALVMRGPDSPGAALALLHRIEAAHGRVRRTRWAGRVLDLDLLAMGDLVLPDPEVWQHWHDLPLDRQKTAAPDGLILPHPRLQDRAFVLVPAAEIAPHWRHPVLGRTLAQLCADLPAQDRAEVRPMPEPTQDPASSGAAGAKQP